jgi:glycosyltransferase involved in cell wall biosynthesis
MNKSVVLKPSIAFKRLYRKYTVSVIVPCRNEEEHIAGSLRSILAQEGLSDDFEVIVVDGMSQDGTRRILSQIAAQTRQVRIIDNGSQRTPCAMNKGIEAARGRYVAILGAHAEYAPDYLRTCLDLLREHPEVCCVGGPIQSVGRSPFGRAVASVMAHPVGVGNARHRHPAYEGYAEGACYPVFRREVFDKVGLYDEALMRNQDDELNYRLAKHGEKVFISPRAQCRYFVRETPSGLFRQYFDYGYWRLAVLRKHKRPASLRQLIPPLFLSCMGTAAVLGLMLPGSSKLSAGVLPATYGATLLLVGAWEAKKFGWRIACLFPVAAGIMHTAYAIGFAAAIFKSRMRYGSVTPSPT